MKIIRSANIKEIDKICSRYLLRKKRVEETVRNIVEHVRLLGDEAVIKYARKFDKARLSSRQLRITQAEISGAYQNISPDFVSTLKLVIENVNKFYKKQIKKSWKIKDEDGVILGEKITPIEKVGVYIPAGTAPLVSSVYMSVLPAKLAGVKRIVLVSPPDKHGNINPHILVVADLLKVNEIYKVGGAQAIAALAFGTKIIPKVDKIVGPGNIYVAEAKRQVFGFVDIDMIAGPTELVVVANKSGNISYISADLLAQAEHLDGLAILITTSKQLAREIKNKVDKGYIILAKNLNEAADITNRIAPEHLQIMLNNPKKFLLKITNAGAIFLGDFTPVAVGDYVAGPSHVLPTTGTARFFSGLSLSDFIKSSHLISYSKKALDKMRVSLEKLALIEGLTKHADSVKVRFTEK
ncbi:MAG: histidinol dehydrogenase [Candidatus Omnitrophica bacterium CG11_big_fil_rev_8_21_14_0_20_42_13]|uniref:Histidinol dehydrogenase n=1 Tax=Candidatus Ghiorseimicrobium undicola TaxID=1974746 RepID=A0A2H0LVJ1_9BACT|nr:MAG: histidinol dehydrogenase [Candidatus Omnitrophica bacterium CG11_big_fil_rev_8_21_14_0_20_42_13]